MDHERPPERRRWWQTRAGWMLLGFLAIAGFFFLTEHRAHLFGALPFILLLLCPLFHLFGHRGHGRRSTHGEHARPESEGPAARTPAFFPRLSPGAAMRAKSR